MIIPSCFHFFLILPQDFLSFSFSDTSLSISLNIFMGLLYISVFFICHWFFFSPFLFYILKASRSLFLICLFFYAHYSIISLTHFISVARTSKLKQIMKLFHIHSCFIRMSFRRLK